MASFKDETTQTDPEICLDEENSSGAKRHKEIGYEEIMRTQPPKPQPKWIVEKYAVIKTWINQQDNKGLKLSLIVMTGCVIAMFWYLQVQVRQKKQTILFALRNLYKL